MRRLSARKAKVRDKLYRCIMTAESPEERTFTTSIGAHEGCIILRGAHGGSPWTSKRETRVK